MMQSLSSKLTKNVPASIVNVQIKILVIFAETYLPLNSIFVINFIVKLHIITILCTLFEYFDDILYAKNHRVLVKLY